MRADAHVVKRERVLRWLARRANEFAQQARRTGELRDIAGAAALTDLVDDFARGRER
ncbi:MAG TPA: hypothetical protein VLT45_05925 [Kofleriaceae bacterium]|nr:hypothetical protein [Kofleriaceae bacterium]